MIPPSSRTSSRLPAAAWRALGLAALALLAVGWPAQAQERETLQEAPLKLEARPVDSVPQQPQQAMVGQPRSDYQIGRQDLLEIRVFDVDELNQTVRVADDGSITMPLLGRMGVAGLTKTQLEAMIAGKLEERFVRNPQVTIFVKEFESKKVAVSGAVKTPGSYEMLGRKTLLELLSMAGGLESDLGDEIIIFRPQEDGTTDRLSVDLERLVYAADPQLNIVVRPGDIIYVPGVEKIRVFVTGAVTSPDAYDVPRSQPVTVLKAITLAGGTTDRAALKKVQVIRTDAYGHRIALDVNLKRVKQGKSEDPILREGDIVLVPESFF